MKIRIAAKQIFVAVISLVGLVTAPYAFASDSAGGNSSNANVLVPACTTLNAQTVLTPQQRARYCVATGSADAANPGGVGVRQYAFTLTLDTVACLPLDSGVERTLEFQNVALGATVVSDNRVKEITTTAFFVLQPLATGGHVIRFQARPLIAGIPPLTVLDRSLSVVCMDDRLPN